jgi:hypothetical protein
MPSTRSSTSSWKITPPGLEVERAVMAGEERGQRA